MSSAAVIIVSFRNPGDVMACLAALAQQTELPERAVICENGGSAHKDRLEALIASGSAAIPFPVTVLDAPDNPGYAGGINRAMAAAPDAPFYWILNPDTIPSPGALAALLRVARNGRDAVGGVSVAEDGKVQNCGLAWSSLTGRAVSLGVGGDPSDLPSREAIEERLDFISGASLLVSNAFVARAGAMRADYFLYCEELEWCLRARKAGLKLGFAPEAVVMHAHGTSTGAAVTHRQRPKLPIYLDTRNRVLTIRDSSPWTAPIAVPSILLFISLRYLPRLALRQWLFAVEGWLAGLRNERDKPGWFLKAS